MIHVQSGRLIASVIGLLVLTLNVDNAFARDLQRVPTPDDEHDPLYVDHDSIRRTNKVVQFKRVLNTPILDVSGTERNWKRKAVGWSSNEIEVAIDCENRTTWIVGTLVAYSGPAATGNVIGSHSPTGEERKPRPIDMRRGSTNGYLTSYVCSR